MLFLYKFKDFILIQIIQSEKVLNAFVVVVFFQNKMICFFFLTVQFWNTKETPKCNSKVSTSQEKDKTEPYMHQEDGTEHVRWLTPSRIPLMMVV